MGIDLLDIAFRIQKNIGARIETEDWFRLAAESGSPRDIRAGQLLELILAQPACRKCRYDLRGMSSKSLCPECGTPFDYSDVDQLWENLRAAIADALSVKKDQITRDSLLIKDLGMT